LRDLVIEQLLGGMPPGPFIREHYTRLPHSVPGGARGLTSFGGWPSVEAILSAPGVDAFMAREGRMDDAPASPSPAKAREFFGLGFTLVIRSAERHDPELARLAAGFAADFRAPVNVHVYATPAGHSGFGWHYDPEDVFVLQTHGVKEYRLRKNTVNPWPVLESMPRDLRLEREVTPSWSCTLRPGDWLYIPTGWWHSARGVEESMTLAVGLMTPSALDLLDFVRKELAGSLPWRRRLPVPGAGDPRDDREKILELSEIGRELGRELARALGDEETARRFLSQAR
jgi:50S ribosomal protein L16 3-hydroxylase